MKKARFFSVVHLLLVSVLLVFLASCVSQKQVKYLQQLQKNDTLKTFQNHRTSDYIIQPHDNLYIRVYGLDEKSYFFFNKQPLTSGSMSNSYGQTEIGLYLDSYVVNDSGYIEFPLVGRLFVKDLKIDQAKNMIQSLINEYLKDAIVAVKMVNFNVTVLGEVKAPGSHVIYQDKINIFEALSLAGDMNEYANRKNVALIRQTKTGSQVVYLDLNSIDIIRSPYYYLEPNDILYIAPLGIKRWGSETFPWALVLSAVSTTLLLISYLKVF
jgi:polysaccharide export outer membrane protein